MGVLVRSGFQEAFVIWDAVGACDRMAALRAPSRMAATMKYPTLYKPREAAQVLGISYPSLKQWIYRGRLATVKTQGGHHGIPETEIDRLLPRAVSKSPIEKRRKNFRRISGRNQLVGRVMDVRINGLIAQETLSLGEHRWTSRSACRGQPGRAPQTVGIRDIESFT